MAPPVGPRAAGQPGVNGKGPELPGAGLPPVAGAPSGGSAGGGGKVAEVKAPLRVYNNSLIKNLAERAAQDFKGDGWSVTEVGNYPYSNIPTSTVYYQAGDSKQKAAAEYLASSYGLRAEQRFAGLKDASPGLIVIVTKDFQRR